MTNDDPMYLRHLEKALEAAELEIKGLEDELREQNKILAEMQEQLAPTRMGEPMIRNCSLTDNMRNDDAARYRALSAWMRDGQPARADNRMAGEMLGLVKEKEKEMDLYHTMRKAAQADKQHINTLEQQLSEARILLEHSSEHIRFGSTQERALYAKIQTFLRDQGLDGPVPNLKPADDTLREQMTLLRGVFQLYIEEHEEFTDENNCTAMACSLEAHHIAKEAHSAGNLVELAIVVIKQLNLTAYADDLRQYVLCEKEPVVWMQSDHLSRFVHHACGAQAALVRCSDHQLMPDFQPLYAPKDRNV